MAGGGIVGIHGTPLPRLLGQAVSHGCVRVANEAILKLKPLVPRHADPHRRLSPRESAPLRGYLARRGFATSRASAFPDRQRRGDVVPFPAG